MHFAREQHCGLIVMRKHPQGALAELLPGSVCEEVFAQSRIPVSVLG